MKESKIVTATRRSIKENLPMGAIISSGSKNPITLHSVDEDLFRLIWAVIAETLVVGGELSRSTKEAICTLVSERSDCSVCINAHQMMSVVAGEVENHEAMNNRDIKKAQHDEALQYTNFILDEMTKDKTQRAIKSSRQSFSSEPSISTAFSSEKTEFSNLNAAAKAEIGLVVLIMDHLNRVSKVIVGDQLSTAMFAVPRPVAKAVEQPGFIRVLSKVMSNLLSSSFKMKREPGFTSSLFTDDGEASGMKALPEHLWGLPVAGLERANAVRRLLDWVDTFETERLVRGGVVPENLISYLEEETKVPYLVSNLTSSEKVKLWVEGNMKDEIGENLYELCCENENSKTICIVLMLASFAPKMAYQSSHWNDLVGKVGKDMAGAIVIWWSLRCTIQDAKYLGKEILDERAIKEILDHSFVPK